MCNKKRGARGLGVKDQLQKKSASRQMSGRRGGSGALVNAEPLEVEFMTAFSFSPVLLYVFTSKWNMLISIKRLGQTI